MTRRRPAHRTVPRSGGQPTRKPKHQFVESADQHLAGFCGSCNLRGQPGDRWHLSTDEIEAQRTYEQRRLGETDE